MTPATPRILVGAFSIEANSFVPSETTRVDFERQVWALGNEVRRHTAGPSNELAGAWDALVEANMMPVGAVAAIASPGASVARDVFELIRHELLERCTGDIAGVYLMLHGSALVTGLNDPEGALLRDIRERLGPGIPIAISLDLHAYLTEQMMVNCDIVTAYRTCPHVDLYRTGRQAGELLARSVLGEISPVCRRVRIPMITPPEHHDSNQEPFRGLQGLCDAAEAQEGILAAALLCTQPWIDVPELGWSAVVTSDANPDLALRSAADIAVQAWSTRNRFLVSTAVPVRDALESAFSKPGPFVVADIGDATNGGSLGNSTEILRGLLARQQVGLPSGPSVLSITDPSAVAMATVAGEGSSIELVVGDGQGGSFNEATAVSGTVRCLWQGTITYSHPAAAGVIDTPGAAAVLDVGDITVILHSRPVRVIDPALYIAVGIDISRQQLLQAKSHVSYRAGFDAVSFGSVLADTGGPTAANLVTLRFTNRPVPLFPFEDVEWTLDDAGCVTGPGTLDPSA
jgi:microcystin degradation protein MlrC